MNRRQFITAIAATLTAAAHAITTKASIQPTSTAPTFEPSPITPDFTNQDVKNTTLNELYNAHYNSKGTVIHTYNHTTNKWEHSYYQPFNPNYQDNVLITNSLQP